MSKIPVQRAQLCDIRVLEPWASRENFEEMPADPR